MKKSTDLTRRAFLEKAAVAAFTAGTTLTLAPLIGNRWAFCAETPTGTEELATRNSLPNIIIINADDLGYGDLGCYGGTAIRTPNIDSLAIEGVRFTDFCSCNALCSPSRFGLLTGRYPQRVGMHWVLYPEKESLGEKAFKTLGRVVGAIEITDIGAFSTVDGIPDDEITLAEALRRVGYRTGMTGKWHLGDIVERPEYHPFYHGFESYFGVPYSNDMHPFPLIRNEEIIEPDISDQTKLTGLYTNAAIEFIEKSKGHPFFFYFAHTFPHQPLFASKEFYGKSRAGRFGDAVEEVDWSVGQILACIERNGLKDNTVIFFTSDNGPWYNGSPGGLRGRKGQSFEGGFRVPLLARWPDHVPAGAVCKAPSINIDLFPTCLAIAGTNSPSDRVIDGKSILGLLTGSETKSPHEALYFYHHDRLEAVRVGKWKCYGEINTYVYPKPLDKKIAAAGKGPPWLYDLETDPGESYNQHSNYPDVSQKLLQMMEDWEKDMKANPKGWMK